MQSLENTLEKFVRKLTTPGGMTAVSTAVLAVTVLPMLGGLPKPYEVREFRAAVTAFMNGETSTPSLEPAYYPHTGRGAPVERIEAQAPARVQRASLEVSAEDLAMLEGADAATLTTLDAVEVAEVFEEPLPACDAECEAVMDEPDPFADEADDAEYGPVEDDAY